MSQWNQFDTAAYSGVSSPRPSPAQGTTATSSTPYARPNGSGPVPRHRASHTMRRADEFYREMAYRFANHGYAVPMPDLVLPPWPRPARAGCHQSARGGDGA